MRFEDRLLRNNVDRGTGDEVPCERYGEEDEYWNAYLNDEISSIAKINRMSMGHNLRWGWISLPLARLLGDIGRNATGPNTPDWTE